MDRIHLMSTNFLRGDSERLNEPHIDLNPKNLRRYNNMEDDIIDTRWEFVEEGIKDYHIVNCIVVVILLFYLLGRLLTFLIS